MSIRKERCPSCRENEGLPVVWGYPDAEDFAAESRGELILGGCVVWDLSLNRQCLKCGHQWATAKN